MKRFCLYLIIAFHLQKLRNISPKHVASYVVFLQETGKKASTIKTDLAAIRFFHDKMENAKYRLPDNDKLGIALERRRFGGVDRTWNAVEFNRMIGKAVEAIREADGQLFICADHGNADVMIDEATGEPYTAHTTNPVPFILVNYDPAYTLRENGVLADIVPTLIEMMGMEQPKEMTGKSLLIKK